MDKKTELEKGFHVINDLSKNKPESIFHYLTPFIEAAGFKWVIVEDQIRIFKDNG